jgi:hypothetical protein
MYEKVVEDGVVYAHDNQQIQNLNKEIRESIRSMLNTFDCATGYILNEYLFENKSVQQISLDTKVNVLTVQRAILRGKKVINDIVARTELIVKLGQIDKLRNGVKDGKNKRRATKDN